MNRKDDPRYKRMYSEGYNRLYKAKKSKRKDAPTDEDVLHSLAMLRDEIRRETAAVEMATRDIWEMA